MDLDEIRARTEERRRREAWLAKPWLVQWFLYFWYTARNVIIVRYWAVKKAVIDYLRHVDARLLFLRDYARDAYLITRGRPLYVRCCNWCSWKPCRNDATIAYMPTGENGEPGETGVMPTECAACAAPLINGQFDVGRWYRAPAWEHNLERRRALVRPVRP